MASKSTAKPLDVATIKHQVVTLMDIKFEPLDVRCEIHSAVEESKIKTEPLEKAAIKIKLVKNTVIVTDEEMARDSHFH